MMSLEEREREIEKVVRIAEVLKLQELLALNKTIKDGLNGIEMSVDLIE